MKDNEIKTVQMPYEYDINVYKLHTAFEKIKICLYCGTNKSLLLNYTRTDHDPDETIFELVKRLIFRKTKHTIRCKCYYCGAQTEINFYTDNHCADLYGIFEKYVNIENAKNGVIDDPNRCNFNKARWIRCK